MSRFVDRQNARFVDLGACECPNTPHDKDWMKVRDKLTYGEQLGLADLANAGGSRASVISLLTLKIIEWSWVDEDGAPVPVSEETFDALEADEASRLLKLVNSAKKATDPKPSGARSPKP